ncbi:hypothetical protein F2P81_014228 [Scophthalmus maximus]|uniref:Uncharacterized protein n=1 Tax=Scophthalmus maximus TaxID=52904 RepID=A0A6A4SVQ0_SCOMX|nr:hypothetical protein F2P81_014228 [Scophthalmus maximus]
MYAHLDDVYDVGAANIMSVTFCGAFYSKRKKKEEKKNTIDSSSIFLTGNYFTIKRTKIVTSSWRTNEERIRNNLVIKESGDSEAIGNDLRRKFSVDVVLFEFRNVGEVDDGVAAS